jgi:hypothetical protein
MGVAHAPTDNLIYDLIAIEYHSLKGQQVYDQYAKDAAEHEDVRKFIEQVRNEDRQRAMRSHELLMKLTKESTMAGSR